ncbi:MAG TPA: hypothetical protein VG273_19290 [Bryobacteraceae bacterium]|jgi:lipopolysaccharide assembly outer membrane protein LptD (OstA)|nr:hypothetical protein [Bryobacteraceae bacterium]
MKRAILFSTFAALALGQQSIPFAKGTYDVTARRQSCEGHLCHFSGDVVFETDAVILHADTVDFNQDTQEIQAQGHVSVKLK